MIELRYLGLKGKPGREVLQYRVVEGNAVVKDWRNISLYVAETIGEYRKLQGFKSEKDKL